LGTLLANTGVIVPALKFEIHHPKRKREERGAKKKRKNRMLATTDAISIESRKGGPRVKNSKEESDVQLTKRRRYKGEYTPIWRRS